MAKVTITLTTEERDTFVRALRNYGQYEGEATPLEQLLMDKLRNAKPVDDPFPVDWSKAPEWATCAVLIKWGGDKYSPTIGEWNFYAVEPTIDTNDYGQPRVNYVSGKWGPGSDPQRFEIPNPPPRVHRRPEGA